MKKISLLTCLFYLSANLLLAQDWSLTGNAGTTPGTNFLGTTDAKALMFKVNNQRSGYIDFAAAKANTSFGFQALKNPSGDNNAAFGYKANSLNTTGRVNTALGAYALYFNTTGYSNVAAGVGALYKNTTASNLVAIGDSALYNNGTGASGYQSIANTAVGSKALYANTTGSQNTANGINALYSNISGYNNTANGSNALYANTTGFYNTAIGAHALYSNSEGPFNTAVGISALYNNTAGRFNTTTGARTLYYNTTGEYNTANGVDALYKNTTGINNTAIGVEALWGNTTGNHNTATGLWALRENTTGYYNSAFGTGALYSNTSGIYNTAIGANALFSNTTGIYNATGLNALASNTTGDDNIGVGQDALNDNTAGEGNIGIGRGALFGSATGNFNTGVGYLASVGTIGSENTIVGAQFTYQFGTVKNNSTAVGYSAYISASNQVRIGDFRVTSIGGNVGWSNLSDGRVKKNIKQNVPGLAFINKLRPVTYNLNLDEADKIMLAGAIKTHNDKILKQPQIDAIVRKAKQQIVYTGFVAQEVEKAAKELNYDFSGVDAAKNDKDLYGLRYAEFVVPLVKAVQELSKMNDEKNTEIKDLKKEMAELKAFVLDNNSQKKIQNEKIITLSNASLEQNIPNPFNNTTTINYTLPNQYSSAKIIITDKSGKSLKEINISGSGRGSSNVDASTMANGAYNYSLHVDGKLIGTKQMVLIK